MNTQLTRRRALQSLAAASVSFTLLPARVRTASDGYVKAGNS